MTIGIPDYLQWVAYLAGSEWPQGDEDAMRRIASHWHDAGGDLSELVPDLNRVRSETVAALQGQTADVADQQFAMLFDGDYSVDQLAEAMSALGDLAENVATQIEYTKMQILASLAIAAVEIGFALAAAPETFGASLAEIPVAEVATQIAVRSVVRELIAQITEKLGEALGKTLLRRLIRDAALEGVKAAALGAGQDVAIQAYQLAAGHRKGIDWGQAGDAAVSSGVAGAVGSPVAKGLSHGLGAAGSRASAAVKGAASGYGAGVAGNVAGAAATGDPLTAAGVFGGAAPGGLTGGAHGARGTHGGGAHEAASHGGGPEVHGGGLEAHAASPPSSTEHTAPPDGAVADHGSAARASDHHGGDPVAPPPQHTREAAAPTPAADTAVAGRTPHSSPDGPPPGPPPPSEFHPGGTDPTHQTPGHAAEPGATRPAGEASGPERAGGSETHPSSDGRHVAPTPDGSERGAQPGTVHDSVQEPPSRTEHSAPSAASAGGAAPTSGSASVTGSASGTTAGTAGAGPTQPHPGTDTSAPAASRASVSEPASAHAASAGVTAARSADAVAAQSRSEASARVSEDSGAERRSSQSSMPPTGSSFVHPQAQPDSSVFAQRERSDDPVHSRQKSGDGWHRRDDVFEHSDGQQPLEDHWTYGGYPDAIRPDVRSLIADPEALWGRDADGQPMTEEQHEALYNKTGPGGEHWQIWPPNAGAVAGTRIMYDNVDAFKRDFGEEAGGVPVDRIGKLDGDYMAVMIGGLPAPFEHRSLPVYSLTQPYSRYVLDGPLPMGWKIEVSEVSSWFGRVGGSIQVLVIDHDGHSVTIPELREQGIVR